jgi:uncharacterized membrane protein
MKNRNVGFLILGIGFVILLIVILFNLGLNQIVSQSCSHGPTCPMYGTIRFQTYLSLIVTSIIFIIGLFFIFTKESERVIFRKVKEKKKKINLEGFDSRERKAIELIRQENGVIFQKTLMEKLGITKVGMTRLLDKLESKQLIERKRRGMNNVIVLK